MNEIFRDTRQIPIIPVLVALMEQMAAHTGPLNLQKTLAGFNFGPTRFVKKFTEFINPYFRVSNPFVPTASGAQDFEPRLRQF